MSILASIVTLYFVGLLFHNLYRDDGEEISEEEFENQLMIDVGLPILSIVCVNILNIIITKFFLFIINLPFQISY